MMYLRSLFNLAKKASVIAALGIWLMIPLPPLGFSQQNPDSTYPPGQWDRVIDGQIFTKPLSLDSGDDNVLIIDSVFHSMNDHALMLRNVSNVYIKNCVIYDVSGFGILLRGTGSTSNVTIDGCKIYNTTGSGIMASQRAENGVDHLNLVIKNNVIFNNGQSEHEHNIYVQATDSLIENNIIYGSSGNGISIRSTGTVRNNIIGNSAKSCIRYFNDHLPGPSTTLVIENNLCQLSTPGIDNSPAISLLQSKTSPVKWLADNYYIRSNTVVLLTEKRYGIAVESKVFDDKYIAVYDNWIINTKESEKNIFPSYIDFMANNTVTNSGIGKNEDLHFLTLSTEVTVSATRPLFSDFLSQ